MDIHKLVETSGVPRRTIYYYSQLGLLPSPRGKGRQFEYEQEHLDRLRRIQQLQQSRYSLKEIQAILHEEGTKSFAADSLLRENLHFSKFQGEVAEPAQAFSNWKRCKLVDGLELNIRWPLTAEARSWLEQRCPEILNQLGG